MERKKKYVPVIARFEADGRLRPFLIEFEEGRRFPIDRILDVRRAACESVGGVGDPLYLPHPRPADLFMV